MRTNALRILTLITLVLSVAAPEARAQIAADEIPIRRGYVWISADGQDTLRVTAEGITKNGEPITGAADFSAYDANEDGTFDVAAIPTLPPSRVGLDQVDNTSDTDKPVSTAQASAIAAGDSWPLRAAKSSSFTLADEKGQHPITAAATVTLPTPTSLGWDATAAQAVEFFVSGGDHAITITDGDDDSSLSQTCSGVDEEGEAVVAWPSSDTTWRVLCRTNDAGGGSGWTIAFLDLTDNAAMCAATEAIGYRASADSVLVSRHTDDFLDAAGDVVASCDDTAPAAPTGLAATAGDGTVALDWNDNAEGDLAATPYAVKRSTTTGSGYSEIGTSATSAYDDDTAVNGTEYFYVVTATDAAGNESPNSSEVTGTPSAGSVDFFVDEFDEASDTPLSSHAPDTAPVGADATWSVAGAEAITVAEGGSGYAWGNGLSDSGAHITLGSLPSSWTVSGSFRIAGMSNATASGLCVGTTSASPTSGGVCLSVNANSELELGTAHLGSSLGSVVTAPTITPTTTHVYEIRYDGTDVRGRVYAAGDPTTVIGEVTATAPAFAGTGVYLHVYSANGRVNWLRITQ